MVLGHCDPKMIFKKSKTRKKTSWFVFMSKATLIIVNSFRNLSHCIICLDVVHVYAGEISPILPRSCRYVPTCSEYSMEAYKRYGFLKGTTLTVWRLCRCNPLGNSPVPLICLICLFFILVWNNGYIFCFEYFIIIFCIQIQVGLDMILQDGLVRINQEKNSTID